MTNWVEKLGIFSIFENKTPRKIHEIKNCSIWINIYGEIKEWYLGRKIDREERENTKIL